MGYNGEYSFVKKKRTSKQKNLLEIFTNDKKQWGKKTSILFQTNARLLAVYSSV